MTDHYSDLATLLLAAAAQRGGQAELARALGIGEARLSDLINEKRHVTIRQAIAVERVLGVSARGILMEAAAARVDEMLAKARDSS
jgi:plasmid maintenance system antidote protein VapI